MKPKSIPQSVFVDKKNLLKLKQKAQYFSIHQNKLLADIGFGDSVSPFKTKGLDFQEVRVYQPGDDIRFIDWKITAKHNKPYTKLYTDEKERQIFLIVDMRSTMKFATQGVFKSVMAAKMATLLSFLAENKNDKIGFTILGDEELETSLSGAGSQNLLLLVDKLEKYGKLSDETEQKSTFLKALSQSEKAIRRGSMVFIISDFSDFDEEAAVIIKRLSNKSVCSLIHTYDILEKEFPKGIFPITDGETFSYIDVKSDALQKKYQESFSKRMEALSTLAKKENVGYLPLKTTDDFLKNLIVYCKGGLI